jgi:hypothetical protein
LFLFIVAARTIFVQLNLIVLKTALIAILFLATIASCSKDNGFAKAYTFSLNGVQVSGDLYSALYHYDTAAGEWAFTGVFNISDTANYAYLQLNFVSQNIIRPGNYNYGQSYANSTTAGFTCVNGPKSYSETSGNLQISQVDSVNHKISGAFQFAAVNTADAANSISISGGSFSNISYTVQ